MSPEPEAGDELRAELNVTPLVDVVLVLLVIFLVVAPRLAQEVPVELPLAEHARDGADTTQPTLTLLADGSVRLNGTVVPDADLGAQLAGLYAARSDRTIFLEADRSLPHGRVVEVLDACRAAGVTSIGVITRPRGDA